VGALELLRLEGREYATTPEAIQGARSYLVSAGVMRPHPAQMSRPISEETEETVG
jgi:SulP family sulfate permease